MLTAFWLYLVMATTGSASPGSWPTGADGALNITSGNTTVACGSVKDYTYINVSSGATLTIGSCASPLVTELGSVGNITINGAVNFKGKIASVGTATSGTPHAITATVTYSISRSTGGTGGFTGGGSGSSTGFGGGGASYYTNTLIDGCGSEPYYDSEGPVSGGAGSSTKSGYGAGASDNGVLIDTVGDSGLTNRSPIFCWLGADATKQNSGGSGGGAGSNGAALWILTKGTFSGSGVFDGRGNNGQTGGSGSLSDKVDCTTDPAHFSCGEIGNNILVQNAGSGGGGSGGKGGYLEIHYHSSSFTGTTFISGGSLGVAGTSPSSNNGTSGGSGSGGTITLSGDQ